MIKRDKSIHFKSLKLAMLGGVSLSMMAFTPVAIAQDVEQTVDQIPTVEQVPAGDEVVVEGIRRVIQDSIKLKREATQVVDCLLYTSPSPRDQRGSRMPSSA